MEIKSYDKIIDNAVTSVEMEGFKIDEQVKLWCKQLLMKEITKEDYINLIKQKAGIAG